MRKEKPKGVTLLEVEGLIRKRGDSAKEDLLAILNERMAQLQQWAPVPSHN